MARDGQARKVSTISGGGSPSEKRSVRWQPLLLCIVQRASGSMLARRHFGLQLTPRVMRACTALVVERRYMGDESLGCGCFSAGLGNTDDCRTGFPRTTLIKRWHCVQIGMIQTRGSHLRLHARAWDVPMLSHLHTRVKRQQQDVRVAAHLLQISRAQSVLPGPSPPLAAEKF